MKTIGYLLFVLLSASLTILKDCDETFGYWEPLHYMLYGYGFQTWEYAPQFALRSYSYLLPWYIVGRLLIWARGSKLLVFYTIRIVMALLSMTSSSYLFSSLEDGKYLTWCMPFYFTSTAMFESGPTLLPNTAAMILTALIWGTYLKEKYNWSLLLTILMSLTTWPYALLFNIIPLAASLRKGLYALKSPKFRTIALMIIIIHFLIERYFYGRWTWPSFNAILYNLNAHNPARFGTESPLYYLKNLFINFNFILPLAILSISPRSGSKRPYMLLLCMWASVISNAILFSLQLHKEERFLYPLFPLIIALAGLNVIQERKIPPLLYQIVAISPILVVSLLRSAGQFYYYSGTMTLLMSSHIDQGRVCMGAEWFRFPSHFWINPKVRVGFVADPEELIDLALPKYYSDNPVESKFNNRNEAEPDQYTELFECNWFLGREKEAHKLGIKRPAHKCLTIPTDGEQWQKWFLPLFKFMEPTWDQYCLYKL